MNFYMKRIQSTITDGHDEEVEPSEELCSSHSTHDQQAMDPNRAFHRPVIEDLGDITF